VASPIVLVWHYYADRNKKRAPGPPPAPVVSARKKAPGSPPAASPTKAVK